MSGLPHLTVPPPLVASSCYVVADPKPEGVILDGTSYLKRTTTAGASRKKGALSFWVIMAKNHPSVFSTAWVVAPTDVTSNPITYMWVVISSTGALSVSSALSSAPGPGGSFNSSNRLRATGAPMHVLVTWDTTVPEIRGYVNGIEVSYASRTQPTLNADLLMGLTGQIERISRYWNSELYPLEGVLSSIARVDGVVPAPTDFGEFNEHGAWVYKAPSPSSWGLDGWLLEFANDADLGNDTSGVGNDFTLMGVTSSDQVDSGPSNIYPVMNDLDKWSTLTVGEGGFAVTLNGASGSGWGGIRATLGVSSGKWIWTVGTTNLAGTEAIVGVCTGTTKLDQDFNGAGSGAWGLNSNGTKRHNGVNTASFGTTWAAPDTIILYLDMDIGAIWTGRWNGSAVVMFGSATLAEVAAGDTTHAMFTGLTGTVYPFIWDNHSVSGVADVMPVNFGQRAWPGAIEPSADFKPICTGNLPEPTIKDPDEAFALELATGANIESNLDTASAGWGGWVEVIKRRDGSTEAWRLRFSDDPTNSWSWTASNTGAKAAKASLNASANYKGERWRVGAAYGCYTAEIAHTNGAATTVTHNLGNSRCAVITRRVSTGGGDTMMYHPELTSGKLVKINDTAIESTSALITSVGANSFQIGSSADTGTYRVIVLVEVDGFISFGKHIGNASNDGPFGATGTLPSQIVLKDITVTGSWFTFDAKRDSYNPATRRMEWDSTNMESTTNVAVDLVPGGYKIRDDDTNNNRSGSTFISIAWGRPVGGICVAPATGR